MGEKRAKSLVGDWIPMRLDLDQDPAVIQMAQRLGQPTEYVVGCLHKVWSWASRHCDAANVTGVTLVLLECALHLPKFGDAMVAVGWLEVDENGWIEFPKWDRWLSQTAKRRALTRLRMRKMRSAKCDDHVTLETSLPLLIEREKKEKRKKERHTTFSETFVRFWATYPRGRKTGKQATWYAWQAAIKRGADPEAIIKASENYAASELGESEFVKGPAAWLRAGMYEDDPTEWRIANGKPKIRITQI